MKKNRIWYILFIGNFVLAIVAGIYNAPMSFMFALFMCIYSFYKINKEE